MGELDGGQDKTAEPVEGFGRFKWRTGPWEQIFDRQIEALKAELARAHAEDRATLYLSCPISTRGGGFSRTNAEIAAFTARRLLHTWGERLFILNPAHYQMESREGTGLILDRVREIWPDHRDSEAYLKELADLYRPGGGDYMRMWLKVLIEDERYRDVPGEGKAKRGLNCGGMFDGFYFLGPSDVRAFFGAGDQGSLTQFVESYFSRKIEMDLAFRQWFTPQSPVARGDADASWEHRRKSFFRYYSIRASATFSPGCHDEWNTLVRLNSRRRGSEAYGPGEELACYFDGRQVSPAATGQEVSPGYEVTAEAAPPLVPAEIAWPTGLRPGQA